MYICNDSVVYVWDNAWYSEYNDAFKTGQTANAGCSCSKDIMIPMLYHEKWLYKLQTIMISTSNTSRSQQQRYIYGDIVTATQQTEESSD